MIRIGTEIKWSTDYDKCIICNSTDHKHKSKGYCVKCYPAHKQEIMPVSVCFKCGRELKGYVDRKSGNFICLSCRATKIKPCYICNQEKTVHTKIGRGVYVCKECSKHIKEGRCHHCGNKGKVIEKKTEPAICYACDVRPPAACSICHMVVKFYKAGENGIIMCRKCYAPAPKKCISCGRFKTPHQKTSKGHICEDCYQRPLRECSICGAHKTSYKKTDDGEYVCRNCYYAILLEQSVADVKGKFASDWAERLFLEYIEDKRRMQSSEIVWRAVSRDKPLFDMLGENFRDVAEITVDTFWKTYHRMTRKRTGQLYAFLADRGYIKHSDMPTEDYQRHYRIISHIESLPEGFQGVVHKYYQRFIDLRAKRLSAGWKETDYGAGSYATIEVTVTILKDFVKYLSESGMNSFAEASIYDAGDYISRHYTYARTIKRFLLWLYQEQQIMWKYRGKWKEPRYATPKPIHDEKYGYLVERLLDDSYPLKESLICLFALIYGIRPKVLRKVKIYDLKEKGDKLYLKLPYFEIELHDKITEKVRRYIQDTFLQNPFDIDNPYLFYGYTYKEPMDEGSIYNIFRKHGVKSHQVLSTIIHRLFNENIRHPAVISKATGIHKATAVRYYDAYNPSVLEEMRLNRELYGEIK